MNFLHHPIYIFSDEDCLVWVLKPLRVRCAFRIHGKRISSSVKIMLRKIAKISTATMRLKLTLTDTVQSFSSYSEASREDYAVRFAYVPLKYIFEDMMTWNFVAVHTSNTYVQFIVVSRMMIKHKSRLSLLMILARNGAAANTLSVTHLHDTRFHISSKNNILHKVQTTQAFIKTNISLLSSTQMLCMDTEGFSWLTFSSFFWRRVNNYFQLCTFALDKHLGDQNNLSFDHVFIYYKDSSLCYSARHKS